MTWSISAARARKLDHIAGDPRVSWLFHTSQYGEVATFHGKAQVLESPTIAQQVWDRLAECARAYSMNALSDDAAVDFVLIETEVQQVELLWPERDIVTPRTVKL